MNLLVHDKTKAQLNAALQSKHHGLLVVGAHGSGKTTLARDFAAQLLDTDKPENYPYYLELVDDAIGIDQVRNLREFMKRKTTGVAAIRRVCLLDGVDSMTTEAANALLKTLEEPAEDTVLLLTAESLAGVPKTIQSRVQIVHITPVAQAQAVEYFLAPGFDKVAITRAHSMSEGRAALMHALLAEPEHPLVASIALAKELLGATPYERLLHVDTLSKDREAIELLLFGLERIASSLVHGAAGKADQTAIRRAHKTLQAIVAAQTAIRHRANTKLLLTDLFINM